MESLKRLVAVPDTLHDQTAETRGVLLHIGDFLHPSGRNVTASGGTAFLLCEGENLPDLAAFQAPGGQKEFQTVAMPGMMAGRNLHSRLTAEIDRRHEHGGRRRQTAVQYPDARFRQGRDHRIPDTRARKAAVPADRNRQIPAGNPRLFRKPDCKRRRDPPNHLIGQLDRLALDSLHCHAADIGAAFQLFPLATEHRFLPSFQSLRQGFSHRTAGRMRISSARFAVPIIARRVHLRNCQAAFLFYRVPV